MEDVWIVVDAEDAIARGILPNGAHERQGDCIPRDGASSHEDALPGNPALHGHVAFYGDPWSTPCFKQARKEKEEQRCSGNICPMQSSRWPCARPGSGRPGPGAAGAAGARSVRREDRRQRGPSRRPGHGFQGQRHRRPQARGLRGQGERQAGRADGPHLLLGPPPHRWSQGRRQGGRGAGGPVLHPLLRRPEGRGGRRPGAARAPGRSRPARPRLGAQEPPARRLGRGRELRQEAQGPAGLHPRRPGARRGHRRRHEGQGRRGELALPHQGRAKARPSTPTCPRATPCATRPRTSTTPCRCSRMPPARSAAARTW